MENEKWKIIGAARAEINPHPGLDPGSTPNNHGWDCGSSPQWGGESIIAKGNEKWKIIRGLWHRNRDSLYGDPTYGVLRLWPEGNLYVTSVPRHVGRLVVPGCAYRRPSLSYPDHPRNRCLWNIGCDADSVLPPVLRGVPCGYCHPVWYSSDNRYLWSAGDGYGRCGNLRMNSYDQHGWQNSGWWWVLSFAW